MENHNRACLSGQDRKGGQHRNSGGQHHQIIHASICLYLIQYVAVFPLSLILKINQHEILF